MNENFIKKFVSLNAFAKIFCLMDDNDQWRNGREFSCVIDMVQWRNALKDRQEAIEWLNKFSEK
jgi:hypothetical protein